MVILITFFCDLRSCISSQIVVSDNYTQPYFLSCFPLSLVFSFDKKKNPLFLFVLSNQGGHRSRCPCPLFLPNSNFMFSEKKEEIGKIAVDDWAMVKKRGEHGNRRMSPELSGRVASRREEEIVEASKQSLCLKKVSFTSWPSTLPALLLGLPPSSSSVLHQDVFIDVTAPICHNLTSAAVCFGLPLFHYSAFPVIIKCFFFFWQLPETFSSLLLFDTQTYVVLHHCPRILDILQLTLRCHSLSPQNVSILSHDRTRAARCFFFFLSLSHLQVNVPLSQNVHKSSISWSVLMPGGIAQSPTIHIVCMLSSTLKNNNCVCISKSTHMTFFPFLCSCLDSDIFGRLMCWQG